MSQFLTLSRSFTAASPIPPRRILAFTPDGTVKLAAGPDEPLCGLSDGALESLQGQPVDVLMSGFQRLEAGASLTPGARVTSDAQGRAVPAAPGARALALALQDALPGDITPVLITFA